MFTPGLSPIQTAATFVRTAQKVAQQEVLKAQKIWASYVSQIDSYLDETYESCKARADHLMARVGDLDLWAKVATVTVIALAALACLVACMTQSVWGLCVGLVFLFSAVYNASKGSEARQLAEKLFKQSIELNEAQMKNIKNELEELAAKMGLSMKALGEKLLAAQQAQTEELKKAQKEAEENILKGQASTVKKAEDNILNGQAGTDKGVQAVGQDVQAVGKDVKEAKDEILSKQEALARKQEAQGLEMLAEMRRLAQEVRQAQTASAPGTPSTPTSEVPQNLAKPTSDVPSKSAFGTPTTPLRKHTEARV